MRSLSRAILVLAVGACVAAPLAVRGAVAQEARSEARAGAPSADTLRDVEVMRRVLVREGLSAGVPRAAVLGATTGYWYGQGAGTSEAYVVAGDGATFVLRTSDPVAPLAGQAKDPAGAPAEPSAWEEAEAEVEGKTRVRTRFAAGPDRYDAAKVEALRGRLLEQLAKFGSKIRGLTPLDHLTVVVVGAGGFGGAYVIRSGSDATAQGPAQELALFEATRAAAGGGPGATVLTVRVSVADCAAAARGDLDLDAFRRRAVVAAY